MIAAGDFASVHEGLEETIDALTPITVPTVLVPGNNETEDALRAACDGWDAATVLHGEATEIDGTAVLRPRRRHPDHPLGLELRPRRGGGGARSSPAARRERCWSSTLRPRAIATNRASGDHLGSQAILEAIEAKRPPARGLRAHPRVLGRRDEIGPTRVLNLGPTGTAIELGVVNDRDQPAARPRRVASRGRPRRGAQRRHAERRAPPPQARQRGAQAARRQRGRDPRRALRLHLRLARGVRPAGRARRQEPDAGREAGRRGSADALAPDRRGVEGRLRAASGRRGRARRGDARGRARGLRGGPSLRRVPVGGRHRPASHPRRPRSREEAARTRACR